MKKKQLIISAILLALVVVALVLALVLSNRETKFYDTGERLGYFNAYAQIRGYAYSGKQFEKITDEAFDLLTEYHKLFDIYFEYEGMNNLCTVNKLYDGEHKVVKVDRKIIDMLLYAKKMYDVTGGEMNIAMGSVLSIWHDYRTAGEKDPVNAKLPPMEELEEAAKHTDINNLIIDEENCTVYLADPKMKLDVGAFAKGYAVEMVAQMLEKKGCTGYIVDVGRNIRTIGTKKDGTPWLSGIINPEGDDYLAIVSLSSQAIVTSGNYERTYIVNGKSYHHIIDRETLMPARGFDSVSIICKNSADGDGLSTALFCMSVEEGKALIESLDGIEALWLLSDGTVVKSSGFSDFEVEYNQ